MTKEGLRKPNYWGSITQASTVRVGNYLGEEAFTPMSSLLPMVHPNDIVLGGWDISGINMAEAMERAQVLAAGLLLLTEAVALRRVFMLIGARETFATGTLRYHM